MLRVGFVIVGSWILIASCTQRVICPAYQSAFIYDKEALRKEFSYFKEDSTPKILTASKNKYLVAEPESYRKKNRKLQTVAMVPVYPVIPDSLKDPGHISQAETNVPDSTAVKVKESLQPGDSAYAITKTKEKYNNDQDNYMWYFRDILVLPDVRVALDEKAKGGKAVTKKKTKKGIGGFFKGLFSKKDKKKKKSDSTTVKPVPIPADTTAAGAKPKEKKKPFGFLKKKPKATTAVPKSGTPARKEENNFGH